MTRPVLAAPDVQAIEAVLVSARQAIDLVCDRWSLLVVHALILGERRFTGLAARTGMTSRLLSARLKTLEETGILYRRPYSLHPPRFEHHLTTMGLDLLPVLLQMDRWEQAWTRGPQGAPAFVHGACGAPLRSQVSCRACGRPAAARDIALKVNRSQLRAAPKKQGRHRRSMLEGEERPAEARLLGASFDVFGDKWGIEVLLCAYFRIHRFGDFRQCIGISANILSDRLGRLVTTGLLAPSRDPQASPGYWLTAKGIDAFAIMVAIHAWADKWVRGRYKSPVRLIHAACGAPFWPALTCGHCHQAVRPRDVAIPEV